jgi:hypothetical protein
MNKQSVKQEMNKQSVKQEMSHKTRNESQIIRR